MNSSTGISNEWLRIHWHTSLTRVFWYKSPCVVSPIAFSKLSSDTDEVPLQDVLNSSRHHSGYPTILHSICVLSYCFESTTSHAPVSSYHALVLLKYYPVSPNHLSMHYRLGVQEVRSTGFSHPLRNSDVCRIRCTQVTVISNKLWLMLTGVPHLGPRVLLAACYINTKI